jgi:hypothetical protein
MSKVARLRDDVGQSTVGVAKCRFDRIGPARIGDRSRLGWLPRTDVGVAAQSIVGRHMHLASAFVAQPRALQLQLSPEGVVFSVSDRRSHRFRDE